MQELEETENYPEFHHKDGFFAKLSVLINLQLDMVAGMLPVK